MEVNYFLYTNCSPYQKYGSNIGQLHPNHMMLKEYKESINTLKLRPNAQESAFGLFGFKNTNNKFIQRIISFGKEYKKNIVHTYDHKIIYAIIENKIRGYNTIDSITHDADKLLLYILGFPHSFVSKFHRKISTHHIESGKHLNQISMLVDNIASQPPFKKDKKYTLRAYFQISKQLQNIEGFKELLEKYNYGENLNISEIQKIQNTKFKNFKGLRLAMYKGLRIFLHL